MVLYMDKGMQMGTYFLSNGFVCPLMAILGVVALCNAFHFPPLLCIGGIPAL
jgi:hypothetical protein